MPNFTTSWLMQHLANKAARLKEPVTDNPVELEVGLHEEIFAECRRRRWQALHGAMSERTHRTEGEPDFIILADNNRTIFVECKSRTGKLSDKQQAFKFAASMNGHTIHVVRSFQEFLKIL